VIFTPENKWLYENPEYVAAVERVTEAYAALFELEESNREAEAKLRAAVKAAVDAKKEVALGLTHQHDHTKGA
jgi:hypothetical protein